MKPLQDYLLTGSGRSGRRAYGLFGLPLMLFWVGVQLPPISHVPGHGLVVLACVYLLACLVSQRLHDIGLSGWWTGLIMLGLILLPPASQWPHLPQWQQLVSLGPLAVVLGSLALVPGQMQFNRYGQQPERLIRSVMPPVAQVQTPPQTRI